MEIIIRIKREDWEEFNENFEANNYITSVEEKIIENMCESASSYLRRATFEIVD